jgi:hypothetical protein
VQSIVQKREQRRDRQWKVVQLPHDDQEEEEEEEEGMGVNNACRWRRQLPPQQQHNNNTIIIIYITTVFSFNLSIKTKQRNCIRTLLHIYDR